MIEERLKELRPIAQQESDELFLKATAPSGPLGIGDMAGEETPHEELTRLSLEMRRETTARGLMIARGEEPPALDRDRRADVIERIQSLVKPAAIEVLRIHIDGIQRRIESYLPIRETPNQRPQPK